MSAKTKAVLTTENTAVVTGQTAPESITPTTLGGFIQDILDSYYNSTDTPLTRTQTFADATARGLAVPDFTGQLALQIDTKTLYISFGTSAGNWQLISNTQIQSDTYAIAGGTDTYAITLTPALIAYAAGNSFKVLFTNANSTAASLNVNTLGAKTIYKNGNVPLIIGDIKAGTIYTLTYDGTNFQLHQGAGSSYQSGVLNPASMTGASSLMMGLAGAITPTKSGNALIIISGEFTSDTTGVDTNFILKKGTGSAPSNGAALSGTSITATARRPSSTTLRMGFTIQSLTQLVVGSTYWIDLGVSNNSSGAVQLFNVSISVIEQ